MQSTYRTLGAFALLSVLCFAQDDPAKQVAERVDAKYNNLRSLKMDFVETYSGAGRVRKESGTLWLKQPGRMRWDYKDPREKIFLSDGKTAFFYVPGERQARKTSLKKLDDLRSPLRYLLGKAKLTKEFENLNLADGAQRIKPENIVLSGVPKRLKERVQQVLFEINPKNQIERLTIEEIDGTVTEFVFSGITESPAVRDNFFKFQRPQNVELLEATELAD
jgi:outer membrane lipoprotein carrier protein